MDSASSLGIKFISLYMLINDTHSCPDRVVDILEACGALDLSSSLSRDVHFSSFLYPLFDLLQLFSLGDAILITIFTEIH